MTTKCGLGFHEWSKHSRSTPDPLVRVVPCLNCHELMVEPEPVKWDSVNVAIFAVLALVSLAVGVAILAYGGAYMLYAMVWLKERML